MMSIVLKKLEHPAAMAMEPVDGIESEGLEGRFTAPMRSLLRAANPRAMQSNSILLRITDLGLGERRRAADEPVELHKATPRFLTPAEACSTSSPTHSR